MTLIMLLNSGISAAATATIVTEVVEEGALEVWQKSSSSAIR